MKRTPPLLLLSLLLLLLGCPVASGPDASAATPGPRATPAPALGPGAGAVFYGSRALAQTNGGLQTLPGWDAVGAREAKLATCTEEAVTLTQGLTFLVCTRGPLGGAKTGWMKVEVTGRDGDAWTFRYLHWSALGGPELGGTGRWVPDEKSPSLTYTHDEDVVGTTGTPPSAPALTDPVPSAPALTTPEPTGPAPGMDAGEPATADPAMQKPPPTAPEPAMQKPPPTAPEPAMRKPPPTEPDPSMRKPPPTEPDPSMRKPPPTGPDPALPTPPAPTPAEGASDR